MNYEPWIIIPGFTFTMISKRISFYTSIIFKRQQLRPRNCNDCPPFRQSLEFPNQLIQLGFSTKILSSLCSMDLVQLLHALTCHRLFFHLDLSSAFCGGDQIFHIRFSLPGGEMTRCNKDTLIGTDLLSTNVWSKRRKTNDAFFVRIFWNLVEFQR